MIIQCKKVQPNQTTTTLPPWVSAARNSIGIRLLSAGAENKKTAFSNGKKFTANNVIVMEPRSKNMTCAVVAV